MLSLLLSLSLGLVLQADVVEQAEQLYAKENYREAARLIEDSLPQLRAEADTEALSGGLFVLASSYFRLGAFPQAFDAQEECYRMDLESGDAGNISSSLNSLAAICLAMEDYPQAETLIRDAIRYEESLGESAALAVRYGMASDILMKQGKLDEAIVFSTKALQIDQAAGRAYQTAIRQSQLAAVYIEAGRLREARTLLEVAAPVFSSEHRTHSLSICREQQGKVAYLEGRLDEALPYLEEALQLSRETGNIYIQKNVISAIARCLRRSDPARAIHYMQQELDLADTLFQHELAQKLSRFSLQYDLSAKEQEILRQQAEIRSRRIQIALLTGVVALLAVVLLVLVLLYLAHDKNQRMLYKAGLLKEQLLKLGHTSNQPEQAEQIKQLAQELSDMGASPVLQLTRREKEVARLCCQGQTSKEIAQQLSISQRTVETHKNNIFRKLNISTTQDLVSLLGPCSDPE